MVSTVAGNGFGTRVRLPAAPRTAHEGLSDEEDEMEDTFDLSGFNIRISIPGSTIPDVYDETLEQLMDLDLGLVLETIIEDELRVGVTTGVPLTVTVVLT